MSASTEPSGVFNHVAISVPADLLGERGRAELLRFYGEVFGWSEMPTMTRDRELLVLRVYSNEQFVFLAANENPMSCPEGDHFGMSVGSPEELEGILERAKKFQAEDARVEIIDKQVEDFGVLKLHNCYLRYLLPLRIELQCYEWGKGFGAQSLPDS
ncbi:MAG: hypothetical protein HRU00_18265 [Myxococcales bacterium]|nr:hypothetical protein [Myxococcales bacterium]